jgi:hypothetical protein
LLPGEDPESYAALLEDFRATWQPVGAAQEWALQQMVDIAWRLQRIAVIEAGLVRAQMYAERLPVVPPEPREPTGLLGVTGRIAEAFDCPPPSRAAIRQYRRDRRDYERAVAKRARALEAANRKRSHRDNDIGRAFGAVDAQDGLAKLSRYQTTLERSFRRALRTLQELQTARASTVAAVIDVTSSTAPSVDDEGLQVPAGPAAVIAVTSSDPGTDPGLMIPILAVPCASAAMEVPTKEDQAAMRPGAAVVLTPIADTPAMPAVMAPIEFCETNPTPIAPAVGEG